MSLSIESTSKYITKPAAAFAAGAAIGMYSQPDLVVNVPIFGYVPAWALYGAVFAIGEEVTSLAHDYLYPHATELTFVNRPIETGFSIVIGAGAAALAFHLINPGALSQIGVPALIASAAAVEIVAGYANEWWLKPSLAQWM